MQQPFWTSFRRAAAGGAVLYIAFWLGLGWWSPIRGEVHFWLLLPVLLLLVCFVASLRARGTTAGRLREFLRAPRRYQFFDESYPSYRFVDLCRALRRLGAASAWAGALEHYYPRHTLQALLRDYSWPITTAAPQTRVCT